jgi:diketogulonate reductase-like aldo/keto reductase
MCDQLLSRRRFNRLIVRLGFALAPAVSARRSQAAAGTNAEVNRSVRTVTFPAGTTVPAVGQGSWHLGQGRHPATVEEQALRTGLSLGMTLIDTSGNYGNGRSEELIARVIADQRDQVFVVTKVETNEVAGDGVARACDASLARLRTATIDLYLLHWPVPSNQFSAVVAGFEQLRAKGKIRAWGVSNFNVGQMDDLFRVPDGHRCATNQVPYSLNNRHIERDVLPWCKEHAMPVMAYSPLGGDNSHLVNDPTLAQIGGEHGCSAAAVALAWATRSGGVIAIPESGSPAHVKENAVALSLTLTPQNLQTLDAAFPGPNHR